MHKTILLNDKKLYSQIMWYVEFWGRDMSYQSLPRNPFINYAIGCWRALSRQWPSEKRLFRWAPKDGFTACHWSASA